MAVGRYVIVCNLAGHYAMGMRAAFLVQGPRSTVQVTLGDRNGGAPMTLKVSPATVPPGDVTFVVKNAGTIVHEAVVLRTDVPFDKLPVDHAGDPPAKVATGGNKVSEDANIGETGDPNLKPGETRPFTIADMVVGKYVLVCNIAGHYATGMRAAFAVQGPRSIVDVTLTDTNGHGPMGLKLSPNNVPAGDVTFVVKNAGTIVHEAVVLQTDVPSDRLPVDHAGDPPVKVKSGGNKVSEDANIGETGDPDLQAGQTRTFTIATMEAGSYVVVCNIAGHYAMGMRAQLTVS
jgi:uncharacterized cupredoxin-like copper-binding protein